MFALNATGARIVALAVEGKERGAIVRILAEEYRSNAEEIAQGVGGLLDELVSGRPAAARWRTRSRVSSSAGPIALPTWYACFPATSLAALPDGTRRVGPLAIVRPAEGVVIATFGRADDPGVVLFDGYLFERRALRASLELDGGATDAQIAAAAYERWGEAVFDRLDGSYLLAIWDPASGAPPARPRCAGPSPGVLRDGVGHVAVRVERAGDCPQR